MNNQNNRSGFTPNDKMSPDEKAQYEAITRRKREEAAKRKEQQKAVEKKKREKRRRRNMKIFGGRMIVFSIVLVLLAAVGFAVFMIFFHSTPDAPSDKGKVRYLYGGAEKRVAPADECIVSGGLYICFNDLSEYIGMAESGSADEMKFILNVKGEESTSAEGNGDEEYIIFYTGGTKVNINGQEITLDIPSVIRGDEVWVSYSFAEKYMNGLSVSYNNKSSVVSVSKIKDEEQSDGKNIVFREVSFKLKASVPEAQLSEDPLVGDIVFNEEGGYKLDFNADLSEYEEYMDPEDSRRDAFLVLVNTQNSLTANDIPTDLVDVKYTSAARKTQQLRLYAGKALEALFKEMQSLEYYDMSVFSGYVSYSYQDTLFSQYISNEMAINPNMTKPEAQEIVTTYAELPGTSDHQTGLAVDMDTMGAYTTDFQYTEEYKWLEENAWKFGFILRYPSDKTDITGKEFEPWHYRYVGRYHALKIHESGLCLEEYLKEIKK